MSLPCNECNPTRPVLKTPDETGYPIRFLQIEWQNCHPMDLSQAVRHPGVIQAQLLNVKPVRKNCVTDVLVKDHFFIYQLVVPLLCQSVDLLDWARHDRRVHAPATGDRNIHPILVCPFAPRFATIWPCAHSSLALPKPWRVNP